MKIYKIQDLLKALPLINSSIILLDVNNFEKLDFLLFLNLFHDLIECNKQYSNHNKILLTKEIIFKIPGISHPNIRSEYKSIRKISKEISGFFYDCVYPVMEGLTQSNFFNIIFNAKRRGLERRHQRRISREDSEINYNFSYRSDRIYPLSYNKYQQFAKKIYIKWKYPKIKKTFIDGVVFGEAKVAIIPTKFKVVSSGDNNQVNRSFIMSKRVVINRKVGLIQKKINGIEKIVFQTEDSFFMNKQKIRYFWNGFDNVINKLKKG